MPKVKSLGCDIIEVMVATQMAKFITEAANKMRVTTRMTKVMKRDCHIIGVMVATRMAK